RGEASAHRMTRFATRSLLLSCGRSSLLSQKWTTSELYSSLLLRKLDIRRIVLARNVLHHGLAALHDLRIAIVGISRRAVQFPALVQRERHLVAERGVVRGGQEAVDFHA